MHKSTSLQSPSRANFVFELSLMLLLSYLSSFFTNFFNLCIENYYEKSSPPSSDYAQNTPTNEF